MTNLLQRFVDFATGEVTADVNNSAVSTDQLNNEDLTSATVDELLAKASSGADLKTTHVPDLSPDASASSVVSLLTGAKNNKQFDLKVFHGQVSTSEVVIANCNKFCVAFVVGREPDNSRRFGDIVAARDRNMVGSNNIATNNSPDGRTYVVNSANDLGLKMASDTYDIRCISFEAEL